MNSANGKWTMWLAGVLATALTTGVFALGNAVVQNDKDARYRDDKITDSVQNNVVEQKEINKDILIALKEMQVDIKYIKKKTNDL